MSRDAQNLFNSYWDRKYRICVYCGHEVLKDKQYVPSCIWCGLDLPEDDLALPLEVCHVECGLSSEPKVVCMDCTEEEN